VVFVAKFLRFFAGVSQSLPLKRMGESGRRKVSKFVRALYQEQALRETGMWYVG
jgi:hypothetical protein